MAKAKAPAQPVQEPPAPEFYDGEEAVDTVVVPPEPKPAEKPTHNPVVRQMAEEFGMSEEEIAAKNPDQLSEIVLATRRAILAQQKRNTADQARDTDRERAKEPPAPPPEPEDDLGISEAEYDPKIVALFRKQQEEIKNLKKANGEIAEREQLRERRTIDDVIDAAFDSLTDFSDKFGTGSVREIEDPVLIKRRKLAIRAAVEGGLNLKNATPRMVAKAIRKEAEDVFGPPVKAAPKTPESAYGVAEGNAEVAERPVRAKGPDGKFVSDEVAQTVQKDLEWATTMQRPTHRRGAAEPKGVSKAVQSVAALQKEQGTGDDADSGYAEKDDFI